MIVHSLCLAQSSLHVLESDISGYPFIRLKYFAYSTKGVMMQGLAAQDFRAFDNLAEANIIETDCPAQSPQSELSLTICIDLSVADDTIFGDRLAKAKLLAAKIVGAMDSITTTCALTDFGAISRMETDFTRQKQVLLARIASIGSTRAARYENGFLFPLSGAIDVCARGGANKTIVLITDGRKGCQAQEIINAAKESGIKVFALSLSDAISTDLIRICSETGGRHFSGLSDTVLYNGYASMVLSLMFNYQPCEMTLKAQPSCDDDHQVRISLPLYSVWDSFSYALPQQTKPKVETDPKYIGFSAVVPYTQATKKITIIPRNSNLNITKFTFKDSRFSVVSGDVPPGGSISLMKDEPYSITVQFAPTDSSIVYTPLVIESEACSGNIVYITGGYPNTSPKVKTLHMTSPTLRQPLIVGDTARVSWEGLLPADVIQLEYRYSPSMKWDTLVTDITGLDYSWPVPDHLTDSAEIRAIQLWPNNIGETKNFIHKNGVRSAFFNPIDGTTCIIACMDSIARLFNSNTGKLIFDLKGHTSGIIWAEIDNAQKYIFTASEDSTIRLWNYSDGSLVKVISADDDITNAAFSADGKFVAVACKHIGIKLFSVADVQPPIVKACDQGFIWFVRFSSDGKYMLTSGAGSIKCWDYPALTLHSTFQCPTNFETVICIGISSDNSVIGGGTWAGNGYVWDFNSGTIKYTINHISDVAKTVNSMSFHKTATDLTIRKQKIPPQTTLLISSGGNDAKIWYASDGTLIAPLEEHTNTVNTAFFNFDGSRVLTASNDSIAKIWNLDKRGLQTDTCGMFRIVKPLLAAKDIDFGTAQAGGVRDTTVNIFIDNQSDFAYDISSITISGKDASLFSIVENGEPFELDSLGNHAVRLRYAPTASGVHSADLTISYPLATKTVKLNGVAIENGLAGGNAVIDFGDVAIGDFRDTTVSVLLRNQTQSSISIDSITSGEPDHGHFRIIEAPWPIVLQTNDVYPVRIRFIPEGEVRRNMVLTVHNSTQFSPSEISLIADGYKPFSDSLLAYVPERVSAKAGDIIDLPLNVVFKGAAPVAANREKVIGQLSYNSTLLEPLDFRETMAIENNIGTITFSVDPQADSLHPKLIKFRAGLGNDTATAIKLHNSHPAKTSRYAIEERSGKFSLLGVCQQGGPRLLETDTRLRLGQAQPNPVVSISTIEFEMLQPDKAKMVLVDIDGREVKTLLDAPLIPGKHSVEVNSDGVAAGVYFYVLTAGTDRKTGRLQIVK